MCGASGTMAQNVRATAGSVRRPARSRLTDPRADLAEVIDTRQKRRRVGDEGQGSEPVADVEGALECYVHYLDCMCARWLRAARARAYGAPHAVDRRLDEWVTLDRIDLERLEREKQQDTTVRCRMCARTSLAHADTHVSSPAFWSSPA